MELSDSTGMIYKPETFRQLKINAILNALAWSDGNKTKAAEALGITNKTLYNLMARYQIPH